ncbi:putative zinc finger mynd-type protein [Neofusicoccum parvum UCRNP2]|uniref:Putative zinc finger mynd-type protein n=1 Tax=Botryosphaeria parva (strain UCR-NP2) TaxID=1287680 RepID=R1ETP4_BOTPV|nr:putative zinc finger mynd-type protein [Neofusicoccum parvum UCRNP2]
MIQRNEVLDRIITGRIRFQYRDSFLSDGSKLNRAIVALSNESARVRYDWRGPIMAFGMGGHGLDQRICRDLNPVDFRHLVDYFRTYTIDSDDEEDSDETENEYGEPKTSRLSKKVMGVKINCEGDQKVFGAPPFEEVEVPLLHPIFHNHDTSDIAALLELPILTAKYPPNKAWVEASPEDLRTRFECYYPFVNQAATFLHLTATKAAKDDPKSTWGWAPMRWQSKVGSVLVVRQDRKPLLPLHAEALSKYCQFHASRLFAHSMGEFEPEKPMTRDEVHATIKRPMFVVYYEKFRDDKQEKELDKGTILPIETPYDM